MASKHFDFKKTAKIEQIKLRKFSNKKSYRNTEKSRFTIGFRNFENINYIHCKSNSLKFVVNNRYKSEKCLIK